MNKTKFKYLNFRKNIIINIIKLSVLFILILNFRFVSFAQQNNELKDWAKFELSTYFYDNLERNKNFELIKCEQRGFQFNGKYLVIFNTNCIKDKRELIIYFIDLKELTSIRFDSVNMKLDFESNKILYKDISDKENLSLLFSNVLSNKMGNLKTIFNLSISTNNKDIFHNNIHKRLVNGLYKISKSYGSSVVIDDLF